MTKYLAGVLSVIAAGVVLIAYGLLAPSARASFDDRGVFAAPASPAMFYRDPSGVAYPAQAVPVGYAPMPVAQPVGYTTYAPAAQPVVAQPAVQVVDAPATRTVVQQAPRRVTTRTVSAPTRDWKKSAMIIGGSSAAAAGVGGLIGGKKGALIGAAIGGGASTIYETTKR